MGIYIALYNLFNHMMVHALGIIVHNAGKNWNEYRCYWLTVLILLTTCLSPSGLGFTIIPQCPRYSCTTVVPDWIHVSILPWPLSVMSDQCTIFPDSLRHNHAKTVMRNLKSDLGKDISKPARRICFLTMDSA